MGDRPQPTVGPILYTAPTLHLLGQAPPFLIGACACPPSCSHLPPSPNWNLVVAGGEPPLLQDRGAYSLEVLGAQVLEATAPLGSGGTPQYLLS